MRSWFVVVERYLTVDSYVQPRLITMPTSSSSQSEGRHKQGAGVKLTEKKNAKGISNFQKLQVQYNKRGVFLSRKYYNIAE